MSLDHHLAEAQRLPPRTDFLLVGPRYQASCPCTWRGPVRTSKLAAELDATAHDVTENPRTGERQGQ